MSSDIYVPSGNFEAEKSKILRNEKQSAMTKIASYAASEQDPYPSPFLSLSDFQIPRTMVEVFKWCRYFYKFDPLISGAVNNLSTFPVTEIILEDMPDYRDTDESSDQLNMYERIFRQKVNITKLLIEIGIDYWLYGNCFVFGELHDASTDGFTKDIQWKHIIRLDPTKMTIDVDPLTQDRIYKWDVPVRVRKIIRDKKPVDQYMKIPEVIKKAVKENKAVVLNSKNVYHFSRPSESGDGSVWGTPVILNVIKLLMYRNILRQAQEAIAREHIVPFRVYYLDPTEKYDPQTNFSNVARAFADQLKNATKDPNYKVVSPIPVNVLNLGGQGRALMLTAEIDQIQAEILAGIGVPREFIFGGVSYSGSTISLRILENLFNPYREMLTDFMNNFVIKRMAEARGDWRSVDDDEMLVKASLSDLKMQDDVQQKQLIINLNGANKVSDDYLYGTLGIDTDKMKQQLKKEIIERLELERTMQLYQAETNYMLQIRQVEYNIMLQMYQMQLQQLAQMGGVPDPILPPGVSDEDKEWHNQLQQALTEQKQAQEQGQLLPPDQDPNVQAAMAPPPEESEGSKVNSWGQKGQGGSQDQSQGQQGQAGSQGQSQGQQGQQGQMQTAAAHREQLMSKIASAMPQFTSLEFVPMAYRPMPTYTPPYYSNVNDMEVLAAPGFKFKPLDVNGMQGMQQGVNAAGTADKMLGASNQGKASMLGSMGEMDKMRVMNAYGKQRLGNSMQESSQTDMSPYPTQLPPVREQNRGGVKLK